MAERAGSAQEQTVETCARMEGPRSHLGRTFLDAVKIPAGSVEIMFIGKRGAEAGKDDMFAQPREVFLEPLHHAPGKVFLHGFIVRWTGTVAGTRPILEGRIPYESKCLACMMPRMDIRWIFQSCGSQEHAGRSIILKHGVRETIGVDLVHIGVVVEPKITRVETS